MAVSISLSITQNSQSIANNTSNVTVKVTASWTYGSYNLTEKPGYVIIDGTKYEFEAPFNTGETDSGSAVIYTKTVDVAHSADGTKTLACSASYTTGVSSGTVTATASKALTSIARASSVTAGNGTLGQTHTITIVPQSSSFKHKVYYTFGGVTTYILGSASAAATGTAIAWLPPKELAAKNTAGTSLSFWFTCDTYNGSTLVGTTAKKVTMTIPNTADFQPACSIAWSDSTGKATTYGKPVKGVSKLSVTVTGTPKYSTAIASYKTTANGSTYTSASFTTAELNTSGTLAISATVTDKRGYSGTASKSISVLDYAAPTISKLDVHRCNQDGTENARGEYIKATFSASIYSLDSKNSVTSCVLGYKKQGASSYTNTSVTWGGGTSITDKTVIFAADGESSYNVILTVADELKTSTRSTSASTAAVIMDFKAEGNGLAFGKTSEKSGIEFGWPIIAGYASAGIDPNTTDMPIILTHVNTPTSGAFYYIHTMFYNTGDGNRAQIATPYNAVASMYHRYCVDGTWSEWRRHINEDEIFKSDTKKNYVLAAPSGAAGTPSFRKLVAADIPNLNTSKLTAGTLGIARGGTGTANLKITYGKATATFSNTQVNQQTISFGHTYTNPPYVATSQIFDQYNLIVRADEVTTTNFKLRIPQLTSSGTRQFCWIAIGV